MLGGEHMDLSSIIDGWQLARELGRGDFATIYQARSGDQTAALKLCTAAHQAAAERLEIEARVLRSLDHPNIPQYIGNGMFEGRPYLLMRLAQGASIKNHIGDNQKAGRLYGDLETLRLMEHLLQALQHVHSKGLVHRDLKDANVLHAPDPSSLRLIDFGFCKESGMSKIRSDDSFWRAGSARFSPPEKLRNPARALASHDVFAVGVLSYRMLTGRYPWFVNKDDAAHELRKEQLTEPLVPVDEINSYVLPAVSMWVSGLLVQDDAKRPNAQTALENAQEILRNAGPSAEAARFVKRTRYPNVIRDAVHGDVWLTDYEYRILATPQMQRLQHIKQLGLTDLVYPGATHSRLSHSIGCVARVEQMLRTLEDRSGVRVDQDLRMAARLYALTHDVLHIPFGHTLEDELQFFIRHDKNPDRRERLIDNPNSEMGNALRDSDVGRALIPYLAGNETTADRIVFADLVSGAFGADVLDYIDRDAHHCGLDNRIDSAIFRQFRLYSLNEPSDRRLVSLIGGKYGLRVDREFAVETVLKERYAMFLKVYTHGTKAAASALLGKALSFTLANKSRRRPFREEVIELLRDDALIDRLQQYTTTPEVSELADRLGARQLPRAVYRGEMLSSTERNTDHYSNRRSWLSDQGLGRPLERLEVEAEMARAIGVHPKQVIVYCPPKAPGYQQVEHWVTRSQNTAPSQQGKAFSDEVARRHLGLWEFWTFANGIADTDKRDKLADISQSRFGMVNMIETDRLQGRLF
ncbi:protein kinase domain-containing protein [Actinomadura sp. 3N407]|uniref:protein kinase domain-containing protein n=1 Tax=Actinomadura sp. 3N407 TaxID=3457423 RepID=UPI003FCEB078